MPLLRLLHQISNMYQNVKETHAELRTQTDLARLRPGHAPSEGTVKGHYLLSTILTCCIFVVPWVPISELRKHIKNSSQCLYLIKTIDIDRLLLYAYDFSRRYHYLPSSNAKFDFLNLLRFKKSKRMDISQFFDCILICFFFLLFICYAMTKQIRTGFDDYFLFGRYNLDQRRSFINFIKIEPASS